MSGQVFAAASGKGGVGKTTTVVNLGVTIRAEGHSVALVDADLGMANLATVLGVEHEPTLHDVLADRATVEEALVEQADRFGIVPGSRNLHGFAEADPERLRGVVETLSEQYDYVIIDSGAGLSHEDLLPLGLADEVLLITTPDPSSVGDTKKVAGFSDILGKPVRGVVVTKSRTEADAESVAAEFDTELLAVIPDDPTVVESTAKGVPLEVYDPDTPAAEAYRQLAKQVTGEEISAEQMPDELEQTAETTDPDPGAGGEPPEDVADEESPTPEEPAPVGTSDEEEEFPTIDAEGTIEGIPISSDEGDRPSPEEDGTGADSGPAPTPDPAEDDHSDDESTAENGSPEVEPAEREASPADPTEAVATDVDDEADDVSPDERESEDADAEASQGTDEEEPEDPESGPDESTDTDEQESKGFFGRLFGVFR